MTDDQTSNLRLVPCMDQDVREWQMVALSGFTAETLAGTHYCLMTWWTWRAALIAHITCCIYCKAVKAHSTPRTP